MDLLKAVENKVVYFCSHVDADGIGARVVAEYYIKPLCKTWDVINFDFGRAEDEFNFEYAKVCDVIIFVDITPLSLEFYNRLKERSQIFLYDHHQTGKDILGDQENYIFDVTRCGTKIFYDELIKGRRKNKCIDWFVELVNTYDLFKTDSELWTAGKSLSAVLYGYVNWRAASYQTDTEKYCKFIDAMLSRFEEKRDFYFTQYEHSIIEKSIEKEESNYQEAKKNLKKRIDNEGNKYLYFECTSKVSLVAYRILKEYKDWAYCICRGTWEKNSTKVSIRSSSESHINCALIAEKHSGGGHFHAAGLELTKEVFDKVRSGKMHLL